MQIDLTRGFISEHISLKSNEVFHYTCGILRRSLSLICGTNLRITAPGQHSSFRNVAAVACRWQHCADLTGPGFEFLNFRSRDERVIA